MNITHNNPSEQSQRSTPESLDPGCEKEKKKSDSKKKHAFRSVSTSSVKVSVSGISGSINDQQGASAASRARRSVKSDQARSPSFSPMKSVFGSHHVLSSDVMKEKKTGLDQMSSQITTLLDKMENFQQESGILASRTAQVTSSASSKKRSVNVKQAESLDLHLKPVLLVPGNKKVLSLDVIDTKIAELGQKAAKIKSRINNLQDLHEQPGIKVHCTDKGYETQPVSVLKEVGDIKKQVDEHQKLLQETYTSLRPKLIKSSLQFSDVNLAQKTSKVKSGLEKSEEEFWKQMLLSEWLTIYEALQQTANFTFTEELFKRPVTESAETDRRVFMKAVQRYIGENMESLGRLYTIIHAREMLIEITPTSEESQILQNRYQMATRSETLLMEQLTEALTYCSCKQEYKMVFNQVTSHQNVMNQLLDRFSSKKFAPTCPALLDEQLPVFMIVGYYLVGNFKKIIEIIQEMDNLIEQIPDLSIFLKIATQLSYCCKGSDFSLGNFKKNINQVVLFADIILELQRVVNKAVDLNKLNADINCKIGLLTLDMIKNVDEWSAELYLILRAADENAQSLITEEQREKHQTMLKRLHGTTKAVKTHKPARSSDVTDKVTNSTESVKQEKSDQNTIESTIDSQIEIAVLNYQLGVSVEHVVRQLECVIHENREKNVNRSALAQYALVDILLDHAERQIKSLNNGRKLLLEHKSSLEQDQLSEKKGRKNFHKLLSMCAQSANWLIKDIERAQQGLNLFAQYCVNHEDVMNELAEQMVYLHDKINDLQHNAQCLPDHLAQLEQTYRIRGEVLKKRGIRCTGHASKTQEIEKQLQVIRSCKHELDQTSVQDKMSQQVKKSYEKAKKMLEEYAQDQIASSFVGRTADVTSGDVRISDEQVEKSSLLESDKEAQSSRDEPYEGISKQVDTSPDDRIQQNCCTLESVMQPSLAKVYVAEGVAEKPTDTNAEPSPITPLPDSLDSQKKNIQSPFPLSMPKTVPEPKQNEPTSMSISGEDESATTVATGTKNRKKNKNKNKNKNKTNAVAIDAPSKGSATSSLVFSGNTIPKRITEALCWNLKHSKKAWSFGPDGCQEMNEDKNKPRKRKSKKSRQSKVQDASRYPAELENMFRMYIQNFVENGCQRSGDPLPSSINWDEWLQRVVARQFFYLPPSQMYSLNSPVENSKIEQDILFLVDALNLPITVEYTATDTRFYQPGQWVQSDVESQQTASILTLSIVNNDWYASITHAFDQEPTESKTM